MHILIPILYIFFGTVCIWIGLTFINGTLFPEKLSEVYAALPNSLLRMLIVLLLFGLGNYCFSISMKYYPVVAGPTSVIFTVLPPIFFTLYVANIAPNWKIILMVVLIVVLALMISLEMDKIQ